MKIIKEQESTSILDGLRTQVQSVSRVDEYYAKKDKEKDVCEMNERSSISVEEV